MAGLITGAPLANPLTAVPPPTAPDVASGGVLCLRGLHKRFGRVQALADVQLTLRAGEVHVLMGQNGAGKSTLIKVLTGVHQADGGQMLLDGQSIDPASPLAAQRLGISTVYQELNLCPNLTVAENILAGRYPRRSMWAGRAIDRPRMLREAQALLARLSLDIDVTLPLARYPVAVQQLVAMARALGVQAKVLILDEPTSSLDDSEVQRLFAVMRQLRAEGLAILFVTHFLDQVYAVADRISVMRNGSFVGEWQPADLPPAALVAAMVGRDLAPAAQASTPVQAEVGEPPWLQASSLVSSQRLAPVSLALQTGQVVGVAGLLGAGRTELARLLFGLDSACGGELKVRGRSVRWRHPAQAVRHGLAFCPEERKAEGIVAELSVRENIVLALQARQGLWPHIGLRQQREMAAHYIQLLGIRTEDAETPIGQLSGGNQQKAVLARWLATAPQLLILDEPTRGIDVAAKQDLMDEVLRLAGQGMAVLFISSELEEVLRVSDRVLVMRNRQLVADLPRGVNTDDLNALISELGPASATRDSAGDL